MNIYVNLELPVNVRIDFGFRPKKAPTKVAEKLQEDIAVREVNHALMRLYYEG